MCTYPKIDDANLKGTLWTFKKRYALKMWVRCEISQMRHFRDMNFYLLDIQYFLLQSRYL